MQEGLRLYPPGAVAVREATENLELRGFVIPRGSWIHVSAAALSHACFLACMALQALVQALGLQKLGQEGVVGVVFCTSC